MDMNEKKSVKAFKRKYKLKKISSQSLSEVLNKQGFTLIRFNGADDDDDVRTLIAALDLQEYVLTYRCFTYQDNKYRLVFVNENLNEEETTIVLAHEEGHIWHKHLNNKNVLGNDIVQEYQANEFSHYLLVDKTGKKKKISICAAVGSLILVIGLVTGYYFKSQHDEKIYTDNLYRTATGSKYHVRDCMYIKDKTDVQRLTREEFDSGEYEPCNACKPD